MDLYDNKKFIPMLLSEVKKPFNNSDYIFELKLDGTRTLIYAEPKKILIKNRRGINLNDTYPELKSISKLVKKKVIFDGEIIIMDNGVPSFEKLQLRAQLKDKTKINYYVKQMPAVFVAYDILYEDHDLTDLPLIERKKYLSKYLDTEYFTKVKYIEKEGIKLFNITKQNQLEGIVAKKKDSVYRINKRSKEWIKIKNLNLDSFYIWGYKIEVNNASLLLAEKIDNKLTYIGKVSVSKNNPDYNLIKKTPITKNYLLEKEGFKYIVPKLMCSVEYMARTKSGQLRQPVYRGLIK